MPNLFMLCGPSGIGKSHLAQTEDLKPVVSRDAIRFSMLREKDEYFSKEELVRSVYVNTLAGLLANGVSVFADSTNLSPIKRQALMLDVYDEYESIVSADEAKTINFITIDCVPEDITSIDDMIALCKERNANRTGRAFVPDESIEKQCKAYVRPDPKTEMWIHKNIHIEDIKEVWEYV